MKAGAPAADEGTRCSSDAGPERRPVRLQPAEAADRSAAAPAPARRLPAAQPVHDRQHVLRLRVRRVRDARRTRDRRAVHRHRRRPRHARRPHRAADRHARARSGGSSTRWPTSCRSGWRRRCSSFRWGLEPLGRLGWAAGFVFVSAGAIRLARFNIQASTDKRYFVGHADPGGRRRAGRRRSISIPTACTTTRSALPALALMLVPAVLMVSTIRFRSFKTIDLQARRLVQDPAGRGHRASSRSPRIRDWTLVVLAYGYLAVRLRRHGHGRASAGAERRPCRRAAATAADAAGRQVRAPARLSLSREPSPLTGAAGLRRALDRQRDRHPRAPAALAGDARSCRRSVPRSAGRSTARARSRPPWSRSRARTAGRSAASSMPTPVSVSVSSTDALVRLRGPRSVSVPAARHRVQRVVDDVGERPADQRAVDQQRPAAAARTRARNMPPVAEPDLVGLDHLLDEIRAGRSARAARVGDEAKLENSDAICRSSRTCDEDRIDAPVEHRPERPARGRRARAAGARPTAGSASAGS